MFNALKQKINSAMQGASTITENFQQQYRQRVSTPDINLIGSTLPMSSNLGIPCDVNVAAGCNLLSKYEDDWKIIHQKNVENVKTGKGVANQIQNIEKRTITQQIVMTDLLYGLANLPNLLAKLKTCQDTLNDVHHLSKVINTELEMLEDLCEECELQEYLLEKQCETSKYKQKKMEALEAYRVKIAAEHQQRINNYEISLTKIQKERQAVFDDAFRHDLEEFKQKGHIPKIHTSLKDEVTLEEVILDDSAGKDALEEFLTGEDILCTTYSKKSY